MVVGKRQDPKEEALRAARALNPRPEAVRAAEFAGSEFFDPRDLEVQRIGVDAGDQRLRQSMSLAVSRNTMTSES
jgi:hypothetical protein